ncbi:MAG: protein-L-isoaspartate O-methyltransferase [Steroidobacteraceae bacterium]|jgi:protein-L-isoaspartate(D-aspartate) O-methyltransferase|nr:protein-L-isoaspartate O-methyltransferase [Steroidobacteraceae bacterium]
MNLESARRQMIDQQVRAWEVLDDAVLDVMRRVPRERFVPEAYREVAFADMEIPLDHGQHMLSPKVDGRLLQALALRRDDEVLEVGTGSGFLAACLASMARSVRSLEIHGDLAEAAARTLRKESVTNVTVERMDASTLDEHDRYDAIALTASLPVYDPRFARALKLGGRLFAVVGSSPIMEARLVTRTGPSEWSTESLFETCMDPMENSPRPPRFSF